MFPTIDKRETGINIRRLMDQRGITVKNVQEYLGLGSVQSVYHWLNGISLPSIDNLYALSELLQTSMEDIVCGNKCRKPLNFDERKRRRLQMYYERLSELYAA